MSANRFILGLKVSYNRFEQFIPHKCKTTVTSNSIREAAINLKEELNNITVVQLESWIKLINIKKAEERQELLLEDFQKLFPLKEKNNG